MAEYTWRQWGSEQTPENEIHADDCYRWQAGIELAGGTWDGEWADLDKTGKGLITIDQFNALESQIQSKVSSYTPKGYDPDSTVQIVPGPDGWNKVEDGILKAVCQPDGVSRNLFPNSRSLSGKSGSGFSVMTGGNFNYLETSSPSSSWIECRFLLNMEYPKSGKLSVSLEFWEEVTGITYVSLGAYSGDTRLKEENNQLSKCTVLSTDGDWTRVGVVLDLANYAGYDADSYFLQFKRGTGNPDTTCRIRKPKAELNDEPTAYVEAPEDYGYPSSSVLSASPQSVEESNKGADV